MSFKTLQHHFDKIERNQVNLQTPFPRNIGDFFFLLRKYSVKFTMRVLLVLAVLVDAAKSYEITLQEWETFKSTNNLSFDNSEDRYRFDIYAKNGKKVAKHNARYARGEVEFTVELNHLSHMTLEEVSAKLNGLKGTDGSPSFEPELDNSTLVVPIDFQVPEEIDWRTKGAITKVANQEECGSCYAISAMGALEAQHFIKYKTLVPLSVQNILDCSRPQGNEGCNGGITTNCFQYVKENGGVDTEESYPYEETDGPCRYKVSNRGAKIKGWKKIPRGNEKALKVAVATIGPISVGIDDASFSFLHYKSGVYYNRRCSTWYLNHAALIVGYGTTRRGTHYWIVKNSWGPSWGDHGYIRMSRNRHNNCGIASFASYPIVH